MISLTAYGNEGAQERFIEETSSPCIPTYDLMPCLSDCYTLSVSSDCSSMSISSSKCNNFVDDSAKRSKASQDQKSKDTGRVGLGTIIECLYENVDDSDEEEQQMYDIFEDTDGLDGIMDHLAFLDSFSDENAFPGCHCTKHISPGISKCPIKTADKQLSKVTKKCKKLYRRNNTLQQGLKSRDILVCLIEDILDLKQSQR